MATVQTEDHTYYYTQDWRGTLVDTSRFYIRTGHHNPTKFPVESRIQVADHVNIGYYELGKLTFIHRLKVFCNTHTHTLLCFSLATDAEVKSKMFRFTEMTADTRPDDPSIKLHSGLYYHCNDVWNPEVGDLRVQFSFAGLEGTKLTVIGQLSNGRIVPFVTNVKISVLLVLEGQHTLHEAFKTEHHLNRISTWSFRFVGWLLLFFAITCTSTLIHILCEWWCAKG